MSISYRCTKGNKRTPPLATPQVITFPRKERKEEKVRSSYQEVSKEGKKKVLLETQV